MTSQERAFQDFADFAAKLKGDEKSEAQTFLFHLLEAFNHDANTLPEGCTFEYRVRFPGDRTKFADLVWPGRVLIEMKSRGEKLSKHYQQTFDYWLNLVPHRPPYVVLCNFDEFWIYDFNTQLQEPMDRFKVSELPPTPLRAQFSLPAQNHADFRQQLGGSHPRSRHNVADVFNPLVAPRRIPRDAPAASSCNASSPCSPRTSACCRTICSPSLLDECRRSENPIGQPATICSASLFRQMNDSKPARGGRFAGVDYFNGGLFSKVEPIELQPARTRPAL